VAARSGWRASSNRPTLRFPWAIVVPNGDSRFSRSTSTWIHCVSCVICANEWMSSWVTTRHGVGPRLTPIAARSCSMGSVVADMRGER
jgi:hypothetical protein